MTFNIVYELSNNGYYLHSMGSLSQYEYAENIGDLVNIVDKALGITMPLRVSRSKVDELYLLRCSGTMFSLI